MESIQIDTGEKRLCVNGDPERVIVFNPTDITFAEMFYQLMQDFGSRQADYKKRADVIEANKEKDANGILVNTADNLALIREVCEYMRGKIDDLFGKGTSQKAFGAALTLDMFAQFFTGITPFIGSARAAKIEKYVTPATVAKRKKHSAMK